MATVSKIETKYVNGIVTFESDALLPTYFHWTKLDIDRAAETHFLKHGISLNHTFENEERLVTRPFQLNDLNGEKGARIFLRIHKDVDERYLNGLCCLLNQEFAALETTTDRMNAYSKKVMEYEDLLLPNFRIKNRNANFEQIEAKDLSEQNYSSQLKPTECATAAAFLEEEMRSQNPLDDWIMDDQVLQNLSDTLFPVPPTKVIPQTQQELQASKKSESRITPLIPKVEPPKKVTINIPQNRLQNSNPIAVENQFSIDEASITLKDEVILDSFDVVLGEQLQRNGDDLSRTVANLQETVQALVNNHDELRRKFEKEQLTWQKERKDMETFNNEVKKELDSIKEKSLTLLPTNSDLISIDKTLLALKVLNDYLPIERFDEPAVRLMNSSEFQFALLYLTLKKVAVSNEPTRESNWPRILYQDTFGPKVLAFSCAGGERTGTGRSKPQWYVTKFLSSFSKLFNLLREHYGGNMTDPEHCRMYLNRKHTLQDKRTKLFKELEKAHKNPRIAELCKQRWKENYYDEHLWYFRHTGDVRAKISIDEGEYTPEELACLHGEDCIRGEDYQFLKYTKGAKLTDEAVTRILTVLRAGGFADENIFAKNNDVPTPLPLAVPVANNKKRLRTEADENVVGKKVGKASTSMEKPPTNRGAKKKKIYWKKKADDGVKETVSDKFDAAVKIALDTSDI